MKTLALVLLALSGATAFAAHSDGDAALEGVAAAQQLGRALSLVAARVRPAVVSVYSERVTRVVQPLDLLQLLLGHSPEEVRAFTHSMGSGMIIDSTGTILTSYHTVRDVDLIKVRMASGRVADATLVAADARSDLAVLRMKRNDTAPLPTVTLGDSSAAEVGNLVLAVGAPFGLSQSVTQGIISAMERGDDDDAYLQTDAPINPGSSGGPLVNMRGEVVGVNAAIASDVGQFAGVGFAVPSNVARRLLPRLSRGERIQRGHLEIEVLDLDDDLAAQLGITVHGTLVTEAIPTTRLAAGDVILSYRGAPVVDARTLATRVAATTPGVRAEMEVLRRGRRERVEVPIAEDPVDEPPPPRPRVDRRLDLARLGVAAVALDPATARARHIAAIRGVIVAEVQPGGRAARGGLEVGDVVLAVGQTAVATVEQLEHALVDAGKRERLLLLVEHEGARRYLAVPIL